MAGFLRRVGVVITEGSRKPRFVALATPRSLLFRNPAFPQSGRLNPYCSSTHACCRRRPGEGADVDSSPSCQRTCRCPVNLKSAWKGPPRAIIKHSISVCFCGWPREVGVRFMREAHHAINHRRCGRSRGPILFTSIHAAAEPQAVGREGTSPYRTQAPAPSLAIGEPSIWGILKLAYRRRVLLGIGLPPHSTNVNLLTRTLR
jgi:hypothetical protein